MSGKNIQGYCQLHGQARIQSRSARRSCRKSKRYPSVTEDEERHTGEETKGCQGKEGCREGVNVFRYDQERFGVQPELEICISKNSKRGFSIWCWHVACAIEAT